VSLDQTLYDGGQTKQQKQIEHLSTELDVQRNEVELYKLVERVNQIYVNILLTRENLDVLDTYKKDIDNRHKDLEAAQQNGLALESSLDELEAESLKTDQSIIDAKTNLAALYKTMELFTGHPFSDATPIDLTPIGGTNKGTDINRPELKMFNLQQELLTSRFELTNDYALPKVSFFAGANYGRPGPNFINQDLRFFGSAGIKVQWNISSLYGLSREKTKYTLNQDMIDVQQQVFLFNLNQQLTTQAAQISSMEEMIAKDKTIVEKRHNVTLTASAQLENGKITVTDYLTQLNAELQAVMNQKIHEVRLMNAQTSYNTTKGITNF
jgi:outer membrane protein TolC